MAKTDNGIKAGEAKGDSAQERCYTPSELKFYAVYKGKRVIDGDLWLPDERGCNFNCYPVKISSMGIHYTRRMRSGSGHLTHSDGRTYYEDWESERVQAKGVSLFPHNPRTES